MTLHLLSRSLFIVAAARQRGQISPDQSELGQLNGGDRIPNHTRHAVAQPKGVDSRPNVASHHAHEVLSTSNPRPQSWVGGQGHCAGTLCVACVCACSGVGWVWGEAYAERADHAVELALCHAGGGCFEGERGVEAVHPQRVQHERRCGEHERAAGPCSCDTHM